MTELEQFGEVYSPDNDNSLEIINGRPLSLASKTPVCVFFLFKT